MSISVECCIMLLYRYAFLWEMRGWGWGWEGKDWAYGPFQTFASLNLHGLTMFTQSFCHWHADELKSRLCNFAYLNSCMLVSLHGTELNCVSEFDRANGGCNLASGPSWIIDVVSSIVRIYDTPWNREQYGDGADAVIESHRLKIDDGVAVTPITIHCNVIMCPCWTSTFSSIYLR